MLKKLRDVRHILTLTMQGSSFPVVWPDPMWLTVIERLAVAGRILLSAPTSAASIEIAERKQEQHTPRGIRRDAQGLSLSICGFLPPSSVPLCSIVRSPCAYITIISILSSSHQHLHHHTESQATSPRVDHQHQPCPEAHI